MNTTKKVALLFVTIFATMSVVSLAVSGDYWITKNEWVDYGSTLVETKWIDIFPTYQQFVIRPEVEGTAYSTYATSVWFSLSSTVTISATVSSSCEYKTPIVSASAKTENGVSISASAGIMTSKEVGQTIAIAHTSPDEAIFSAKTIKLKVQVYAHHWYLHKYGLDFFRGWVDLGIDSSKTPCHKVQLSYKILDLDVATYIGVPIEKDDYIITTTRPIYDIIIEPDGSLRKVIVGWTTYQTWSYSNGPYPFAAKTYRETYEYNKNIAETTYPYVGAYTENLYVKEKVSTFASLSLTVTSSVDLGAGIGSTKVSVKITGSIKVEAAAGASTSQMYGFKPGWYDPQNGGPTKHLRVKQLTFGSLWVQLY
ncbi:MAG: hypothetical protein ACTSVB_08425 [Candidatus Heimdallarchaeaceae archaeon]